MRSLVDTQCWLWMCAQPEAFSRRTRELLLAPETVRLLSVASIWEIAIKHDLGKLPLPSAPQDFIPSRLSITGTEALAITASHALRVSILPRIHRDPFDRMIVAQALVEGVPVLTVDRMLGRYGVERLKP